MSDDEIGRTAFRDALDALRATIMTQKDPRREIQLAEFEEQLAEIERDCHFSHQEGHPISAARSNKVAKLRKDLEALRSVDAH